MKLTEKVNSKSVFLRYKITFLSDFLDTVLRLNVKETIHVLLETLFCKLKVEMANVSN